MKRTLRTVPAALLAAVLGATPLASAQDSGFPTQAQPGANFVRAMKDTGSYGSGESSVSVTRMPPITWKGREVGVWQTANGPTLLMGENSSFVAILAGDKPMVTYDPPSAYDWPLKVGKTWTATWNLTDHASNQTFPVQLQAAVEAYEDVTIAAGTFKGYRIRTTDTLGNQDVRWFSTELGIWLKEQLVRTEKHRNGPGTRETELVSQTIKKTTP